MTIEQFTTYPQDPSLDAVANATLPGAVTRLRGLGWTFGLTDLVRPASALCNPYTRQIVCRVRVAKGRRRDRMYVLPHEIGHALDFEAGGRVAGMLQFERRPSITLARALGIENAGAQEALGEAIAYEGRETSENRSWILSSIYWHVRRRIIYRWSHVRDPRTIELAKMLLEGPKPYLGDYWQWVGDRIEPI